MLRRLALVLALGSAGLATWGAQTASACSYPADRPPMTERLAAVPAAFVGTVVARNDTPNPAYVELRFRVERAYKGDLGDEVVVRTGSNDGMCGLGARPGDRLALLLFTFAPGQWSAGYGESVSPEELEDAARALAAPEAPPDATPAPPTAAPAPPTARPRSARGRAQPSRRRAVRSRPATRSRRSATTFRWTQTAVLTR